MVSFLFVSLSWDDNVGRKMIYVCVNEKSFLSNEQNGDDQQNLEKAYTHLLGSKPRNLQSITNLFF